MNFAVLFLSVSAFAAAIAFSNATQLSAAAVSGCAEAFSLVLKLAGGICFWSGMMRVAEMAGICKALGKLLSPFVKVVFPGLETHSKAANLIVMNISANLLGLGNSATPLGIAAMKELSRQNGEKNIASNYMVSFAVINSSSIQLLPTTLAVLRSAYGCGNPMDILPAVVCCSALSLAVGLFFARAIPLYKGRKKT